MDRGVRIVAIRGAGGGAVVIRDVEALSTVVGVPARTLREAPEYEEFAHMMTPHPLRDVLASAIGR